MTLRELATVIVASARVQAWWEAPDGYIASARPTPSAGGRHPLELCVVALRVDGLAARVWDFDAASCEFIDAGVAGESRDAAVSATRDALATDSSPAAIIFAVAHFTRTLSRYPNGATLVLRDAGALLATLHLCASAAGLASCIVGTAGALRYECGSTLVGDVGALALGSSVGEGDRVPR